MTRILKKPEEYIQQFRNYNVVDDLQEAEEFYQEVKKEFPDLKRSDIEFQSGYDPVSAHYRFNCKNPNYDRELETYYNDVEKENIRNLKEEKIRNIRYVIARISVNDLKLEELESLDNIVGKLK